jgi:uncharacterized membrane protein
MSLEVATTEEIWKDMQNEGFFIFILFFFVVILKYYFIKAYLTLRALARKRHSKGKEKVYGSGRRRKSQSKK